MGKIFPVGYGSVPINCLPGDNGTIELAEHVTFMAGGTV